MDPSSTTMISSTGRVWARTLFKARSTRARRLNVGMTTEISTSVSMLVDYIKKLLYATGVLGAYHRWRNRYTLTVVMFHRVLEPQDPRWMSCDPDYTLRADHFSACLGFLARHYNVVSVEQVLAARRGQATLPRCALLITFDDGWADNVMYALPRMAAHALPGLIFVVADAVDRDAAFFQERIVAAFRLGRLEAARLRQVLRLHVDELPALRGEGLDEIRSLVKVVEDMPQARRERLLQDLGAALSDGCRQMVTHTELGQLADGGIAIGVHGKTHVPLTQATDLDAELTGARQSLAARRPEAAPPETLSFPHGRFTAEVAERARLAGFELLFNSVPAINPTRHSVDGMLARAGLETEVMIDRAGRFRAERLALYLFRRPHQALST
ncbi:MAG: hypothetical protein ACKVQR_18300 [Aquabacterium sp.]